MVIFKLQWSPLHRWTHTNTQTLHIHTSHTQSSSPINDTPTDLLKDQNNDHIRVLGTVLHPQVHYESLPITPNTTAREVIVALVDKYATSTEDKSPDAFYLTEVRGVPWRLCCQLDCISHQLIDALLLATFQSQHEQSSFGSLDGFHSISHYSNYIIIIRLPTSFNAMESIHDTDPKEKKTTLKLILCLKWQSNGWQH